MTLQDFVEMSRINNLLVTERNAEKQNLVTGWQHPNYKLSVRMEGRYPSVNNLRKLSEVDMRLHKLHRKELLRVLRKEIQGSV